MFLFKSAGATYRRVVSQAIHAFPHGPADVRGDEFVLLSKNRQDCTLTEKQVQYVAKLGEVRPASPAELETLFPNVGAASRWRHVVELYAVRPLTQPFNLADIAGCNARRYDTVQGFAKIDDEDAHALLGHLCATNEDAVLAYLTEAERPYPG